MKKKELKRTSLDDVDLGKGDYMNILDYTSRYSTSREAAFTVGVIPPTIQVGDEVIVGIPCGGHEKSYRAEVVSVDPLCVRCLETVVSE